MIKKIALLILLFPFFFSSCNKEETEIVREPADIFGVWQQADNSYLQFNSDYIVRELQVFTLEGVEVGRWDWNDVYFYEPGYNLVVYALSEYDVNVYQVVELTEERMVWCWVDAIETLNTDDLGHLVGDIINKAQEGYVLDPELYQSFNRLTEEEFETLLDSLHHIYEPWDYIPE